MGFCEDGSNCTHDKPLLMKSETTALPRIAFYNGLPQLEMNIETFHRFERLVFCVM
jgi:hypothetical protein